jgi:hypothetical protein
MAGIKEKYLTLKRKFSLPEYDILNQEFEIDDIGAETEIVLAKIRQRMTEKLEFYAKMIESRLQPESSISDLYEAHYIDDDEKNDAYSIFKRLMLIIRKSVLVALTNKEDENASFIKETFESWGTIKKDLESHISRLLSLWKKETDIKDDLSYLG